MLKNGSVSNGDTVTSYASKHRFKPGDLLDMELDLTKKSYTDGAAGILSYSVNGKSLGVAFKDILPEGKYALCVGIQRQDRLEILAVFGRERKS